MFIIAIRDASEVDMDNPYPHFWNPPGYGVDMDIIKLSPYCRKWRIRIIHIHIHVEYGYPVDIHKLSNYLQSHLKYHQIK